MRDQEAERQCAFVAEVKRSFGDVVFALCGERRGEGWGMQEAASPERSRVEKAEEDVEKRAGFITILTTWRR